MKCEHKQTGNLGTSALAETCQHRFNVFSGAGKMILDLLPKRQERHDKFKDAQSVVAVASQISQSSLLTPSRSSFSSLPMGMAVLCFPPRGLLGGG